MVGKECLIVRSASTICATTCLEGPLEGGRDGAKVVVVKFVGIDIIVLLKESRLLG